MNVNFKTKSPLVLYIHGKGGNAAECDHYRPLFPGHEVIGLDYQTFTPWEAGEEIHEEVERIKIEYEGITLIANSIGAFFCMNAEIDRLISKAYFISPVVDGICQCHGGAIESGGRNPNCLRRGSVMGLFVLCAGASNQMECSD